jgi:lipocalin
MGKIQMLANNESPFTSSRLAPAASSPPPYPRVRIANILGVWLNVTAAPYPCNRSALYSGGDYHAR